MPKLLSALSYVCINIQNEKLVLQYKKEIEVSNHDLKRSNEELESIIKVLDNKIVQMNEDNKIIQKIPQQSPKDAINTVTSKAPKIQRKLIKNSTTLYTYEDYIQEEDLKALQKLEVEIDSIATLFHLETQISSAIILRLAQALSHYSIILSNYSLFKPLSKEVDRLSVCIFNKPDVFIQTCNDVCILLESFIYVLKRWRTTLFYKGIKDPNMYDTSMIKDIENIILILEEDTNSSQNTLEYF